MSSIQRDLYGSAANTTIPKRRPRILVDPETHDLFRHLRLFQPYSMVQSVKMAGKLLLAVRSILTVEEQQQIRDSEDIEEILKLLADINSRLDEM